MLITKKNEPIILKEFMKYMDEYGNKYESDARDYILDNFFPNLYDNCSPDIIMEVKEALGLTHENGDFYQSHFDRIKDFYGLDKNIVEVGAGWYPAFGEKIAKEQLKIGKGTITVYDPELIITSPKYVNMTLVKDKFTRDTRISRSDLLVGILPCEATQTIIEQAGLNHKDFYLAMCGCVHSDNPFVTNPLYYQQEVVNYASRVCREANLGELVIDHLPENFEINYPILRNKRR